MNKYNKLFIISVCMSVSLASHSANATNYHTGTLKEFLAPLNEWTTKPDLVSEVGMRCSALMNVTATKIIQAGAKSIVSTHELERVENIFLNASLSLRETLKSEKDDGALNLHRLKSIWVINYTKLPIANTYSPSDESASSQDYRFCRAYEENYVILNTFFLGSVRK